VELMQAEAMLQAVKTKRLNAAYEYIQKLSQLCVLAGEKERFFEFAKSGKF